jgi:hypothetical protein
VKWFEKGGSFVVRLPEFDVAIWSGTDERDEVRFVAMGLKDPKERGYLDDWYIQAGEIDFVKLDELYSAARRLAGRVSQKLDELERLLRRGDVVGLEPGTG